MWISRARFSATPHCVFDVLRAGGPPEYALFTQPGHATKWQTVQGSEAVLLSENGLREVVSQFCLCPSCLHAPMAFLACVFNLNAQFQKRSTQTISACPVFFRSGLAALCNKGLNLSDINGT